MNKDKIIKESSLFSEIISKKQSVRNNYFSIYYQKSDMNKYGITIPKKIGKANVRNKIKRQIKNIIITNEKNIPKEYNYVIIIKEATTTTDYGSLEKELLNLIKKVGK
jgi:ribonuclease P protein component